MCCCRWQLLSALPAPTKAVWTKLNTPRPLRWSTTRTLPICRYQNTLSDPMSHSIHASSGNYTTNPLHTYIAIKTFLLCSLLYQSRKRGMLENDLLLSTFVEKYLKEFSAEQTAVYDDLINGVSNDWDIYYWATETKPTPPEFDTEIMALLKQHVKNTERVQRIRQPDL